jgi:hypothetical protein
MVTVGSKGEILNPKSQIKNIFKRREFLIPVCLSPPWERIKVRG